MGECDIRGSICRASWRIENQLLFIGEVRRGAEGFAVSDSLSLSVSLPVPGASFYLYERKQRSAR